MPRSRGSEMPQRQQSPRVPLHLKTTACSESNSVVRHSVDRSPKLDDHRRSPRSPLPEKKRGTRVADLETKLSRTQEELKKLKAQLAATEAAKRNAELKLEETKKKAAAANVEEQEVQQVDSDGSEMKAADPPEPLPVDESVNSQATDVFEVVTSGSVETEPQHSDEVDSYKEDEGEATKAVIEEELPKGSAEISELSAKLIEMDRVIESLASESESLKKQVEEAKESVAASKTKEEEMGAKLAEAEAELSASRADAARLGEELAAVREAKAGLEAEMRRMRVQTDQWRKAAEAAAAVLSTAEDAGERRVAERCGSMDKHVGGFIGSPVTGCVESEEDGSGGGKRKGGGGMRMFWKKAPK